jgi:hypothetical protein
MQLHFDASKRLSEIKAEFEHSFPGLKIEFVKRAHKESEGSSREDIIKEDLALKQLSNGHELHNLEIRANMRVSEVEQMFKDHFGLFIQIFRKTGRNWIETVHTDSWTLKHQMEISEESHAKGNVVPQDIEDLDLE